MGMCNLNITGCQKQQRGFKEQEAGRAVSGATHTLFCYSIRLIS